MKKILALFTCVLMLHVAAPVLAAKRAPSGAVRHGGSVSKSSKSGVPAKTQKRKKSRGRSARNARAGAKGTAASPVKTQSAGKKSFLKPASTKAGYIARLLVNEPPFPGEKGWVGEADTKAAMLAILWVCHGRIHHVPSGYRQREIAATDGGDIIDVITAGGEKGQMDGFYRDKSGAFKAVPRVNARVDYLMKIAARDANGRFARLLRYAQGLANAYVEHGISGADRYAGLKVVNAVRVTGRAYAWMSDRDYYSPGGSFVKIPDANSGSLGNNRFFTLKERKQ